jgi:hypothetical protein
MAPLAIERSIAAWLRLREILPGHESAILNVLAILDRMCRGIRATLPGAESLRHLGFDGEREGEDVDGERGGGSEGQRAHALFFSWETASLFSEARSPDTMASFFFALQRMTWASRRRASAKAPNCSWKTSAIGGSSLVVWQPGRVDAAGWFRPSRAGSAGSGTWRTGPHAYCRDP